MVIDSGSCNLDSHLFAKSSPYWSATRSIVLRMTSMGTPTLAAPCTGATWFVWCRSDSS